MRILHTGPMRPGSLTDAHRRSFAILGHDLTVLDQCPYLECVPKPLRKLQLHALAGPGIAAYNRDLLRQARTVRPDMIYVDQAAYLWPETVVALRPTTPQLVHYTSEYLNFRTYWYRHFFRSVSHYDVHVISNKLNIPLLRQRGARRIVMMKFGYDSVHHRPVRLTQEEWVRYASDAVFVGHWEQNTERMIYGLRTAGVVVAVWGKGWHRARSLSDRKRIVPAPVDAYAKILTAARICLCFFSRWNRNTSAGRHFEIPAIGSFLLAERTEDHKDFLKEGYEAEYFDGLEELIKKAKFYLDHPKEREAIALRGHQKCLASHCTHTDRVEQILKAIGSADGT